MPPDGGHKFVLSPWILGVCEHTEQNRDRFFTPGQEGDARWDDLRGQNVDDIWQGYDDVDSEDTHYAGRAKRHFRGMWSGKEALMANDNEFVPSFSDGTINVLMGDGTVRSLYKAQELAEYGDDDDPSFLIEVGPSSPVDILTKLER